MNKEQTCVIISSYPQSSIDNGLLSFTIESWKEQEYDILLATHSPVTKDIQSSVKYFIYSDENDALEYPDQSSLSFNTYESNFSYRTNYGNTMGGHSYAILNNLKNSLQLLEIKGYTHFIFIDDDQFLTFENHQVLKDKLAGFDSTIYDYWFFMETEYLTVSNLFGGKIQHFKDFLVSIKNSNDYLEYCKSTTGFSLENFISKFRRENIEKSYTLEYPPRSIFKNNKLLGCSSMGKVYIPGLDNFKVSLDIVRNVNNSDYLYIVLKSPSSNKKIDLIIYNDNQIIQEIKDMSPSQYMWWGYPINGEKWRAECKIKDKIISQVEFTVDQIKNNIYSNIEFY